MGFIIRGFIWDIPTLIFAYVLFWGPSGLGSLTGFLKGVLTGVYKGSIVDFYGISAEIITLLFWRRFLIIII